MMRNRQMMAPPEGAAAKPLHTGATLRRLFGYLRPYLGLLLGLVVIIVVSGGAFALGPLLIGRAIDQFIIPGDRAGLARTMLLLIGVFAVGAAATGAQTLTIGRIGQNLLARLRTEIFAKLQSLPLSYYDQNEIGDLMSRLTNDVDTLNQFFGQGLIQLVGGVFQMLAIAIAMLLLRWQLALASMAVLPLLLLTTVLISRRAQLAFRSSRAVLGSVSAELEESISGAKIAQAFNRGAENAQTFTALNASNRDANINAVGITATLAPAVGIYNALATAIVAGLGGYFVLQGLMSLGLVVSFLNYVQQFFRPVQMISQFWGQAQLALAGAERIFELLDVPLAMQDAAQAAVMPPIDGRVAFEDVSFGYNPATLVLEGVSFTAEPGQIVALVGETGAGKTTLINLIPRFYDPTHGRVLIDGIDLRGVTRASLRAQIGIVLQDSFLFSGTLLENIRYGRLDASDAEVEAAARVVGVHDFIAALPEGYQTNLGERGDTISQGQRQLLSFARAVLADPRILILDEATSNVDTRTEQLIQQALTGLMAGRTSFVIAHRLSTIRNADQLLVIEDGRILERASGTETESAHDRLLAQGGSYAHLYERQFAHQPR
jgi:ABC-type multidrug transport system fused ATPase/permease subunit